MVRVGLQLHTVREALLFDPDWALAEVAGAGFRLVELSCHDANEPWECLRMSSAFLSRACDRVGLRVTGGRVVNLDPVNVDDVVSFYVDLGAEYITVPIGYFPTPETLAERAAAYNRMGERCAQRGLGFYYAHHYHELQVVGGKVVLDALMEQTDPALVGLEFNSYWLMRGLVSPTSVFKRYEGRIGLVEQQDFPLEEVERLDMWHFFRHHPIAEGIRWGVPLTGGEIENIHPVQCNLFTEIGEGIVKVQEVVDQANASGRVRYIMLRQDYTRMPSEFDSVRLSAENVRQVRGVEW